MVKLKVVIAREDGVILNELTLIEPFGEGAIGEVVFEHAITEVLQNKWETDESV